MSMTSMSKMTENIFYGKHILEKTSWNGVNVISNEENKFNLTRLVIDHGFKDLYNLSRNKLWKDFDEYIKENDSKSDISKITNTPNMSKEEIEIAGSYYPEIYMHVTTELIDINYLAKVSELMMLVNQELKQRNITLDDKIREYKSSIHNNISKEDDKSTPIDIEINESDTIDDIKIEAKHIDSEKFSIGSYHGFEIVIYDRLNAVNFNAIYKQIRDDKSYPFKRYISNNNSLWNTIQGFYENGLESLILLEGTEKVPSQNNENSNVSKRNIPDFKSLPHNLSTLQSLGLCKKFIGNNDGSIPGNYFSRMLLDALLMNLDTKYYCLVVKIMNEIDRRAQVMRKTVEEEIERYKTETNEIIEQQKTYIKNVNAGKSHHLSGSIIIKRKQNGYYSIVFKEINISENTTVHKNDIILRNIYNPNDMRNLFSFYVRNLDLPFIKYQEKIGYDIIDIKETISFIEDLQNHCFNYEYNVDKAINKYLSSHRVANNQFIGNMFEFYCSKRFNIPVYRFGKTEDISLTKIDHGIDLLDVDNKIFGQCKYYIKNHLTSSMLKEFINFCECEDFKNWKKILYVNEGIAISNKVQHMNGFEIIYIKQSDFEEFLHQYEYKEEVKKETQKPQIVIESIVKKDLADSTKHKYKLKQMDQMEKIKNNKFSALNNFSESQCIEIRSFIIDLLFKQTGVFLDELLETISNHFHICFGEQSFQQLCSDFTYKNTDASYPVIDGRKLIRRNVSMEEYKQYIEDKIGYGEYYKDEFIKEMFEYYKITEKDHWFSSRFKDMFVGSATKYKRRNERPVLELIKYDRDEIYRKYFEEHPFSTMEQFNEYFHRYENEQTWRKIPYVQINDIEVCKKFINENKDNPRLVTMFNKKFRRGVDKRNFKKEEILAILDE